jgi:acetyl-CoA carboxylase biotin carboxyl carrier protein
MPRSDVLSEVTGKVWKLQLAVGASVTPDDSIKMEIPVFSGESGTLTEIRVAEGDSVEEGQIVAVIET